MHEHHPPTCAGFFVALLCVHKAVHIIRGGLLAFDQKRARHREAVRRSACINVKCVSMPLIHLYLVLFCVWALN